MRCANGENVGRRDDKAVVCGAEDPRSANVRHGLRMRKRTIAPKELFAAALPI
jgi:hypothetical protein